MERFVTYTAGKEEEGLAISAWLRRLGFSAHQIGRMKFRRGGICLNGEWSRVNRTVHAGDLLRLQLMDNDRDLRAGTDRAPAGGRVEWADPDPSVGPLTVLYEDPDILAVHKRAGLVCHPSPGHYADTLSNAAAAYLRGQGITGRLYLLGRLDRDTSGIVVFAKHAEAAAMLSGQRKQGGFEKIYLAEVRGSFSGCPKSGKIEAPLSRIPDTMHMQVDPDIRTAKRQGLSIRSWRRIRTASLRKPCAGVPSSMDGPIRSGSIWPIQAILWSGSPCMACMPGPSELERRCPRRKRSICICMPGNAASVSLLQEKWSRSRILHRDGQNNTVLYGNYSENYSEDRNSRTAHSDPAVYHHYIHSCPGAGWKALISQGAGSATMLCL